MSARPREGDRTGVVCRCRCGRWLPLVWAFTWTDAGQFYVQRLPEHLDGEAAWVARTRPVSNPLVGRPPRNACRVHCPGSSTPPSGRAWRQRYAQPDDQRAVQVG